MTSEMLTFSQVKAHAKQGEAAAEGDKEGFGKRQTGPKAVDGNHVASDDRGLAVSITRAVAQLQDAMDAAIQAGLIVEPSFKTISGRFNEFGVSVDSHLCNVQIYRKLA